MRARPVAVHGRGNRAGAGRRDARPSAQVRGARVAHGSSAELHETLLSVGRSRMAEFAIRTSMRRSVLRVPTLASIV